MSLHFSSPSGTICGAVSCGCAPCSGAPPRYEPGTATVGLLYLGPIVQPVVRRAATLSKIMRSFMSITLRWRNCGSSQQFAPLACAGPLLDEVEDGRDEENTEEARSQHPPDDRRSHDLACHGASAGSSPQRDCTQDEGEGGHQDWPKQQARSLRGRSRQGFAVLI